MKKALVITLILIGACCLVKVEAQCQELVATLFSGNYTRIFRFGEDDYEQIDNGYVEYDLTGHRMCFTPTGKSELKKDCICKDPQTGSYTNIAVYDTTCKFRPLKFFPEIEVPKVDNYVGEVVAGGENEKLGESVYFGKDSREVNEMIFTTYKCGPVKIAFTDSERDFHLRMDFYNLDTKMTFDGWKIKCPGQQDSSCGASSH